MDQWLTNIAADTSHRSQQQKVIARQARRSRRRVLPSASNRIVEQLTYPASGQCGAIYPVAANTRLVAGQPLTQTVLKCRLEPLNFADYAPITFTAAERAAAGTGIPARRMRLLRAGSRTATATWGVAGLQQSARSVTPPAGRNPGQPLSDATWSKRRVTCNKDISRVQGRPGRPRVPRRVSGHP